MALLGISTAGVLVRPFRFFLLSFSFEDSVLFGRYRMPSHIHLHKLSVFAPLSQSLDLLTLLLLVFKGRGGGRVEEGKRGNGEEIGG